MAALDPTDLVDLYWAGRTTLVTRRDQLPIYDRAFRRFFLDEHEGVPEPLRAAITPAAQANAVLEIPATEPGEHDDADDRPARLGYMASDVELFRNKSFAACTPDELAALRRIAHRIRLCHRAAALGAPRRRAPGEGTTSARPCERRCACTASQRSSSGGNGEGGSAPSS